mmetsp:Transcript_50794/g.75954  ORF Transcript_50794/g.75954 Transcript_50794/m.75954 type:complete len:112 (-) Transcript_50794:1353-1688(-)
MHPSPEVDKVLVRIPTQFEFAPADRTPTAVAINETLCYSRQFCIVLAHTVFVPIQLPLEAFSQLVKARIGLGNAAQPINRAPATDLALTAHTSGSSIFSCLEVQEPEKAVA